ncbi:MAG: hypothetical protein VB049_03990, partial [Candidatus Pelethousia sp.]|nr:hypothetical protein [Candidatus Pelethousia sp.]
MLRFEIKPSPPLPEGMEIPNGISLKLARLLYARGARTAAQMEAFLHPSDFQFHSPFFFFDMDKAVA